MINRDKLSLFVIFERGRCDERMDERLSFRINTSSSDLQQLIALAVVK